MSSDQHTTPPSAGTKNWANIIQTTKGPVGLFALLILVIYGILVLVFFTGGLSPFAKDFLGIALVALLFVIVGCIGSIVWYRPQHLIERPASRLRREMPDEEMAPSTSGDIEVAPIVKAQGAEVLYSEEERRPTLGFWFRELRPYLHQAAHYSIPTYYLDTKLNVIDWNIAFEVVFEDLVGHIRGKHVNWFIARLANHDQVFNHARQFTKDVIEKGAFPYVDMEPLEYHSQKYGAVHTVKVAAQLSDTHGVGKAWSVALIPKQINWPVFEEKLFARIHADKRWSVYSASYDRVLLRFPPYKALIEDVVSVVPHGNMSVADLACGTGNVTQELVKRGHRVTAIEDNLGMLDRFTSKHFDPEVTKLIKSSIEHMEFIPSESFDAVVMVNALYALEHPLECLRSINRILRPDGVLGLSTTHRKTDLDPLLNGIEEALKKAGKLTQLASDWDTVYKVNKSLETTVVRRYTQDEVREMVSMAGFDIIKDVPSTYEGAVMLIHARKRQPSVDSSVIGENNGR